MMMMAFPSTRGTEYVMKSNQLLPEYKIQERHDISTSFFNVMTFRHILPPVFLGSTYLLATFSFVCERLPFLPLLPLKRLSTGVRTNNSLWFPCPIRIKPLFI